MKRDTVINVLLIIVGIILAIALFGAGVLWKRAEQKKTEIAFVCALSLSQPEQAGRRSGEHSASSVIAP